MDENLDYYKQKCETAEKNLENLKDLAHKAVADYEDLKKKFDQNHKQYDQIRDENENLQKKVAELKCENEEVNKQLQEVNRLIQPAYEEFSELNSKYEIEGQLKNQAEKFAASLANENNKLKRQSQMLLDLMNDKGVTVSELATITQETEEEINNDNSIARDPSEHFNQIIDELRDELAETKTHLKQSTDKLKDSKQQEQLWRKKYEYERLNADRVNHSLKQTQSSLKDYKRASTMVVDEYNRLMDKFETEQSLKEEAINFASKALSQKNIIQRQSVAAITDAAGDKRVHKAFEEIEQLQGTLDKERTENAKKISDLEKALEDSGDVESLQDQVEFVTNQVKDLKEQLKDMTLWRDKLDKENKELTDKLDVAEQRLRPPPPPPPPPPPSLPILRPLAKLLNKGKKRGDAATPGTKTDKTDPVFNQALDEMMARIKSGKALKPVANLRRISSEGDEPKEPSAPVVNSEGAMTELHNLFKVSAMKRSRSVDINKANTNNNEEPLTEFQLALKKIKETSVQRKEEKKNLSLIEESEEANESTDHGSAAM